MRFRDGLALTALMLGPASTAFAQAAPAAITVTSATLKANETIPKDHTADGKNVSPALAWSGAPAATKQFALVCDDPDVPMPGVLTGTRRCATPTPAQ